MYPDPLLTANLYCADCLDEALYQVVGPSWRAIRQYDPASETYLWALRSSEGGEHLKLRLHGPEALANPARALLRHAANAFFARLGTPEERRPPAWKEAGALVVDDEAGSGHPDCSLVWTRYRRSHVWLGGGPFLDDGGSVSRLTRCLAAACERVLLLEPDATGKIPLRVRQSTLLEGLVAGLSVSGFAADARLAYLAYHRDTLLRSRARTEAGNLHGLLELFDQRIESMGPSAGTMRQAARSVWTQGSTEAEPEGAVAGWCRALANLAWYIRPLCEEDPDYRIDPLAEDPCFVPVFKAYHGFANQLGLNPVEEAFAHHLLRSVASGEETAADENLQPTARAARIT